MKVVLIICAAIVGILAAAVTYSTLKGYTRWYWLDLQARVFVDGKRVHAYVHQSRQVFFITRWDTPRPHSYEIVLPDESESFPQDCGQWVAPRLFVFALGDVNPPCLNTIGDEPANAAAEAPVGPLQRDGNTFEFRTRDGKLVRILL